MKKEEYEKNSRKNSDTDFNFLSEEKERNENRKRESVISLPLSTTEKLNNASKKSKISFDDLYSAYNHDVILLVKSFTEGKKIYSFLMFLLFL